MSTETELRTALREDLNRRITPALVLRSTGAMNPLRTAFQTATAHLTPGDRCTTCGAPDPDGQLLVIVTPDEDLAECVECARPVDRHGRPCGQLHDGHWIPVKVVHLPEAPEWVGAEVVAR